MIIRTLTILALAIAVSGAVAERSVQAAEGRAGVFPDVDLMERSLTKGVSTKADAEALLGQPIGRGGALSGVEPGRPREVWVYGEFGWSLIDMKGGVMRLHFDQRLLMVYFMDDRFDGFWWHGNAAAMTGGSGG